MKKYLMLSMAVLTALNVLMLFGATSARAAETRPVSAAAVCSLDIPALRQHFTRTGHPLARIESRHAGEDVIAASVYLKDGKLFWSVRVDAAEARIISSLYHLGPAGFGVSIKVSKGHGLKREISDTQRLRRHMMGDGQPWGDWVAGIKATCADDYRNGAPEIL